MFPLHRILVCLGWFGLVLAAGSGPLWAESPLRVGVAEVDITPPTLLFRSGNGRPKRRASRPHRS